MKRKKKTCKIKIFKKMFIVAITRGSHHSIWHISNNKQRIWWRRKFI